MKKLSAEGLTIVLSILLAFSIDAWWGNRVEQKQVTASLTALLNDLEQTVVELERAAGIHLRRIESVNALMQLGLEGEVHISNDSTATLIRRSSRPTTVDAQISTLTSMINSGQLSNLSNSALRSEIAMWDQLLADLQGTQSQLIRILEEVYNPWLASQVYIIQNSRPDPRFNPDYAELLSNFVFHNHLAKVLVWSNVSLNEISSLADSGRDLIGHIRKELEGRTA